MQSAIVASSVVGVVSHGAMTHPRPRNALSSPATAGSYGSDLSCAGDACYWYQVGCQIGCPSCVLDLDQKGCGSGNECCSKSEGLMEPTNNDPEFRTWDPYGESKNPNQHKYNPWRAPGKAPVADPCGVASGGNNPGSYAAVPAGYSGGDRALKVLPEQESTLWQAGAVAQVGWGLSAQHSGGYSYRLCPKSSAITEECFQSNTLSFSGNSSIHFNDDSQADKTIPTKTFVAPDGTQWRTNPIPACAYTTKRGRATPACPSGTMFEPGFDEFTQGFIRPDASGGKNHFSIMDEVHVPKTPGSYLLSWRWDCEEADQVWTSCADIEIVDGPVPAPTPPPVEPDATCSSSYQTCARTIGGECVECCPGSMFIYSSQGNICYGGKTDVQV